MKHEDIVEDCVKGDGQCKPLGLLSDSPADSPFRTGARLNVDDPANRIKTSILIIANTMGVPTPNPAEALPKADVVIHCGNLAGHPRFRAPPEQYTRIFTMLRDIDAPVKIAIPGRFDACLDSVFWRRLCTHLDDTNSSLASTYRSYEHDSLEVVERARRDGIYVLVDEGTHEISLNNGAHMKVYTSPYTVQGPWKLMGFIYDKGTHTFDIPTGTDVAITHGGPSKILDHGLFCVEPETRYGRVGCENLRDAVGVALPRIHCFGQNAESNGVVRGKWLAEGEYQPLTILGGAGSVAQIMTPQDGPFFHTEKVEGRTLETQVPVMHVSVDDKNRGGLGLEEGKETLFVNAATHLGLEQPWYLVDIELRKIQEGPQIKEDEKV
ncbi:unnamed protein product [Discula destructiva]